MHFLETPSFAHNRSPSSSNFIIEEDSRSDISDYPISANGNDSNTSARDFWARRRLLKGLVGVMCILVLLLAAAVSILGVLYMQTFPSFETCRTRTCTRTATLFMKTMDETVDPCDDFHKFACGNWISDTAAVVSVAVYDHTTIMRDRIVGRLRSLTENITNEDIESLQQVRIMYNTCVDLVAIEEAGLSPLVDLVTRLIRPNATLGATLGLIHRETGQDYVFDLSIGPSFQNTSVYLLSIDQPELPVVKANFLYTPAVVAAYERLIEKVLLRLGKEKGFPPLKKDAKTTAKKIAAFEQLFALAMSDEDDRGKASTANLITLKELNLLFRNGGVGEGNATGNVTQSKPATRRDNFFNWTEYVDTLFNGLADVEVNDDFILNLDDVAYIRKVAQLLAKTDPEQLKLYITWELIYTFGKDVTKEVRDLFNAFTAISEGTESTPNRHTECILLLDQSLPFALTHKYVLKYVKDATIQEAREMYRNILSAFKAEVGLLEWMDVRTKKRALDKANRVEGYIGFPAWLKDPVAVDAFYAALRFNNSSFFRNILTMMKWIAEKALREYVGPVDRSWTSDSPAEADAFYDDERNAITFPAGFLQEPFIGMGLKAVDYGALGSVLGHELTHGFDTMGRYSDEYGRLNAWWTLDTLEHFVSKAQCFEDQYSTFWLPELGVVPGPNNTVNGKRTLAENIADNGGIREAFQAYAYYVETRGSPEPRLPGLEKYSSEQLFFLSFAQSWCSYLSPAALTDMVETNVHSPPKFRITGPLANFPDFARVWSCPAGSRMNPEDKCVLWGGRDDVRVTKTSKTH